jgi:hypothetical protein
MTTLNVPVDSSTLAALLVQAGYTVEPPAVVTPTPPPALPSHAVIYDGKLEWLGDWSGGGVAIDYANTTLVPGHTVAAITNVSPWGYWLPYALHFDTSAFTYLALQLKPVAPGAHFGLVAYTSTGSTTDITVGSLDTIDAYATGIDNATGVVSYKVPLVALKSAKIDLYKILLQDKSGTKGTTWGVVDARFV